MVSVKQLKKFLEQRIKTNNLVNDYLQMLAFVKPYAVRAILAVTICIPIGSLDAVIALAIKPYMDTVMIQKTAAVSWYIPVLVVLFTALQSALNYFALYLNAWVGGKIAKDLKAKLYDKLLSLDTSFFDQHYSGEVTQRFNTDVDAACTGFLNNLKIFVSRLFSSLSLICVLFYNSWQLALIAVVILGCAFAPLTKIRAQIKDVMNRMVSSGGSVVTAYNETHAGNKIITSYNLANYQRQRFRRILDDIFRFSIKLIQRTSWLSPLMRILVAIGIGITIGYGSYLIVAGKITAGNFVSFITALIMLYTPIKSFGDNATSVHQSLLAVERVFKVLNLHSKIVDRPNALPLSGEIKEISFEGVDFSYLPGVEILKKITFSAHAGEMIALIGNSGGGKSTLINLIPRFYDVTAGCIKINGRDIRDYTLQSLRANIAVVFQDNFLFSGSLKDNVLLGKPNATNDEIYQALKMAYLEDFVRELPAGMNTQIGERGILLSGGQKQRVAIARALIKDAPIVILDEATSALDNKSEAIVQQALENLMKNRTVFVIAHRLSTVQNANKIIAINAGEIVEIGSSAELLKNPKGIYSSLYAMQFANKS